jgi:hypothetical protein
MTPATDGYPQVASRQTSQGQRQLISVLHQARRLKFVALSHRLKPLAVS